MGYNVIIYFNILGRSSMYSGVQEIFNKFCYKNLTLGGAMGNEFNSLFNNIKDLVINSRNKDI